MKKILLPIIFASTLCLGITGCDAIEELKEDIYAYFDVEKQIEEVAVMVVNEIVYRNYGSGEVRCTRVKLQEKKGENSWIAHAYFENDMYLVCHVTYKDEKVYVKILP